MARVTLKIPTCTPLEVEILISYGALGAWFENTVEMSIYLDRNVV